ncbi:CCA tRNA nucleotidyltransferase [Candidatus Woesearchaeota archaeon]|nr:CCA tRNA nucleotidyltransferase [Candidatus Woesearchaeota archaeon]
MKPTIYTEVLSQIKPSEIEQKKFEKVTKLFLTALNSKLKHACGILGGSGAKDTWLAGAHDVDIFVQFDYQKFAAKSMRLSDILEKTLQNTFPKSKINRLYGSRDYFQLRYEGIDFEIIPILKVTQPAQAKNITDLSPLHSLWVNKHAVKQKDDIRLAKQFCKANGLYGAESYISGFSGYVLEILVAHYGSFEKLLKASLKWKDKEVVDPANHYPKKDALFHLNSSKQHSPLVLVDPMDKNRNASAALSRDKFIKFKTKAGEFLKKPAVSFFVKPELSLLVLQKETKQNKLHLVFLEVQPKTGKRDVVGSQLVKAFEFIQKRLKVFGVQSSGWDWDKSKEAVFYFFTTKDKQPLYELRAGPPLELKEYVIDFRKRHKDTFEKDGKIWAKIKVEHTELGEFVKHLVKEGYVKERVGNIKINLRENIIL